MLSGPNQPSRRLGNRRSLSEPSEHGDVPHRYGSCFLEIMRTIKLTGREASIVRAIGFTEAMLGAEIQDNSRMEPEDVTDALNALMAAGFVESIPYYEEVGLAEMPSTSFEVNPAYVHELRMALSRRL